MEREREEARCRAGTPTDLWLVSLSPTLVTLLASALALPPVVGPTPLPSSLAMSPFAPLAVAVATALGRHTLPLCFSLPAIVAVASTSAYTAYPLAGSLSTSLTVLPVSLLATDAIRATLRAVRSSDTPSSSTSTSASASASPSAVSSASSTSSMSLLRSGLSKARAAVERERERARLAEREREREREMDRVRADLGATATAGGVVLNLGHLTATILLSRRDEDEAESRAGRGRRRVLVSAEARDTLAGATLSDALPFPTLPCSPVTRTVGPLAGAAVWQGAAVDMAVVVGEGRRRDDDALPAVAGMPLVRPECDEELEGAAHTEDVVDAAVGVFGHRESMLARHRADPLSAAERTREGPRGLLLLPRCAPPLAPSVPTPLSVTLADLSLTLYRPPPTLSLTPDLTTPPPLSLVVDGSSGCLASPAHSPVARPSAPPAAPSSSTPPDTLPPALAPPSSGALACYTLGATTAQLVTTPDDSLRICLALVPGATTPTLPLPPATALSPSPYLSLASLSLSAGPFCVCFYSVSYSGIVVGKVEGTVKLDGVQGEKEDVKEHEEKEDVNEAVRQVQVGVLVDI